ncbi:hypothetical protein MCHI_003467 [Candidatus Magnetoovum chiemensis]|nr:hypothetical protein MCHI_003467 [Candidatus Magnetoovum chiemensis]
MITARHELAHTAATSYIIDTNNLKNCVYFMEELMSNLKEYSR